jgi:RNA polymerase sigma-70 factor (ECF subfamily)
LRLNNNPIQLTASIETPQLVELLKQNDRKGFILLYDNYASALLGVINRMVNNLTLAEDILQDTLVKVFTKIDQYDAAKGTFFTWLFNIARHTTIDFLRSKQHRQQLQKRQIGCEFLSNTFSENENGEFNGIKRIVEKLDLQYREVINLVYISGYTQTEVAKILDIPVGTVKTRARAALQILRKHFLA